MLWHRSRGDKRAGSPDASITIAFLWNNAISSLPSSAGEDLYTLDIFFYFSFFPRLYEPRRSSWKRGSKAPCNRRPATLPRGRRWLLCEPSRGVNAWRLAQTAKPRYAACGGALSAVCPCICPSANYPRTNTCMPALTRAHVQHMHAYTFVLACIDVDCRSGAMC